MPLVSNIEEKITMKRNVLIKLSIFSTQFGFGFGTGFVRFGFEKSRIRISKNIEKMDALVIHSSYYTIYP